MTGALIFYSLAEQPLKHQKTDIVAASLFQPSLSPKIIADKYGDKQGSMKKIAITSAKGMNFTEAKIKTVVHAINTPRMNCKKIFRVLCFFKPQRTLGTSVWFVLETAPRYLSG